MERMAGALASPEPLRAWWELASDPRGTALLVELIAAANHRAGAEGRGRRRSRTTCGRCRWSAWPRPSLEYGVDPEEFPPALIAAAMQGVAFGRRAGPGRAATTRLRRGRDGDGPARRSASKRRAGDLGVDGPPHKLGTIVQTLVSRRSTPAMTSRPRRGRAVRRHPRSPRRGRPAARPAAARSSTTSSGPGMLHACFVRSPFARARIAAIDAAAALALPGVHAVFIAADLNPGVHEQWYTSMGKDVPDTPRPPLAEGEVALRRRSRWRWSSPTTATSPRTPSTSSRSTTSRCRRSSTTRPRTAPRRWCTRLPGQRRRRRLGRPVSRRAGRGVRRRPRTTSRRRSTSRRTRRCRWRPAAWSSSGRARS